MIVLHSDASRLIFGVWGWLIGCWLARGTRPSDRDAIHDTIHDHVGSVPAAYPLKKPLCVVHRRRSARGTTVSTSNQARQSANRPDRPHDAHGPSLARAVSDSISPDMAATVTPRGPTRRGMGVQRRVYRARRHRAGAVGAREPMAAIPTALLLTARWKSSSPGRVRCRERAYTEIVCSWDPPFPRPRW